MQVQATDVVVDGVPVYVEVHPVEVIGFETDAELADAGERARQVLVKLEDVSAAAAQTIRRIFQNLENAISDIKPDTLELEFGLSVSGEAGFVLKAGGASEFSIKAGWDFLERAKAESGQAGGD
jgi:hypothetical protein